MDENKVKLINEHGFVDHQNPTHIGIDSVYECDIEHANSDTTNWTGDYINIFKSPFSASITNSTADNPKQLIIAFARTIKLQQIGIGENNGGNFSNAKISLLGSGGATRGIYDGSLDNTKRTSLNAEFKFELCNSLLFEFYTADPVSISNITIQKSTYNTSQIQGVDQDGTFRIAGISKTNSLNVALKEYQGDAFGRLRVSEPYTIFDNSLTSANSDTIFWDTLTNGTGSGSYQNSTSSFNLSVSAIGDYVIRQTKQRFKYQPGKSHQILMTGLFTVPAGVRVRAGLLDYDNVGLATIDNTPRNGVFFEAEGTSLYACIANNAVTTEKVERANWNVDKLDGTGPSGFVLVPGNTQILFADLEWLGVGTVRVGVVMDGEIVICHEFHHANNGFTDVYMRTANLPVSYALESLDGTAGSIKQICSSVISEGGFNPRGVDLSISNDTAVAIDSGTTELLIGMRLKEDHFEFSVLPKAIKALNDASVSGKVSLCFNPTYAGTVTWVDLPNSSIQYAVNNNNTVSDKGIVISSDFVPDAGVQAAGKITTEIESSLRIGKDLANNRDEIWLVFDAYGATTIRGIIDFKDLI